MRGQLLRPTHRYRLLKDCRGYPLAPLRQNPSPNYQIPRTDCCHRLTTNKLNISRDRFCNVRAKNYLNSRSVRT
jgi:hypothetical protein